MSYSAVSWWREREGWLWWAGQFVLNANQFIHKLNQIVGLESGRAVGGCW
jgi:hypothetical protein